MDLDFVVVRMSDNRRVFEGLVRDVGNEQARWKPSPAKWSILEVINHLYDEEREDFRQRLEIVLADPTKPLPPIRPQEWVIERAYNERELQVSLDSFLGEREQSLFWLRSLSAPNWDNRHERASGSLSAGDLLASWLAHDFLHLRQLARLHWQYVGAISVPYDTTYAGPWQES
jgi:hypothetical protein